MGGHDHSLTLDEADQGWEWRREIGSNLRPSALSHRGTDFRLARTIMAPSPTPASSPTAFGKWLRKIPHLEHPHLEHGVGSTGANSSRPD